MGIIQEKMSWHSKRSNAYKKPQNKITLLEQLFYFCHNVNDMSNKTIFIECQKVVMKYLCQRNADRFHRVKKIFQDAPLASRGI